MLGRKCVEVRHLRCRKGEWIDSFPGLRTSTAALPGAIICDLYEVVVENFARIFSQICENNEKQFVYL